METIEKLKIRHQAELQQAEREAAILAKLPAAPNSIMETRGLGWWATYKVKTPAAVAAMVRLYAPHIVPTVEVRDGCLYRQPMELLPARLRDLPGQETIFSLNVDQGRGFGPCVKFEFHTKLGEDIVRVICELPNNGRASAQMTSPNFDRQGYPTGDGASKPNAALRGLFHDHIQWTPNQRGLDARFTYTLIDDGPEYRETLEILENTEFSNWWGA